MANTRTQKAPFEVGSIVRSTQPHQPGEYVVTGYGGHNGETVVDLKPAPGNSETGETWAYLSDVRA